MHFKHWPDVEQWRHLVKPLQAVSGMKPDVSLIANVAGRDGSTWRPEDLHLHLAARFRRSDGGQDWHEATACFEETCPAMAQRIADHAAGRKTGHEKE